MNAVWCRFLALILALVPVACAAQPVPQATENAPLFSQAELDQMLAPVALYPDSLLSQLLMAATYPLEIVEAARWSNAHPGFKGQEAVRAAEGQSWDPSVKSMVAFPDILRRMDADIEWTRDLGDAFLAQQEQVMDTVQALRQRAEDAGNLQSNEHVEVVREREVIYLRDPYPDRVYVPWYDPWRVYGSWWWPSYRPVYWDPWPGYYNYGLYYWGPTIVIGRGFYYGHCDWRTRQIRIVQTTPFYYRHPVPPHRVWEHEYKHRRGVPYPDWKVHDRYADRYARPPRTDRGRPDTGAVRTDYRDGGQPPRARDAGPGTRPVERGGPARESLETQGRDAGPAPGASTPDNARRGPREQTGRSTERESRASSPARGDSTGRDDAGAERGGSPPVAPEMPYQRPPDRSTTPAAPAPAPGQYEPARSAGTPRQGPSVAPPGNAGVLQSPGHRDTSQPGYQGTPQRSDRGASSRPSPSVPRDRMDAAPQRNYSAPAPQRNYSAPVPQSNYSVPAPQRNYSAPVPERAEPRGGNGVPSRAPRPDAARAPRGEQSVSSSFGESRGGGQNRSRGDRGGQRDR